MRIKDLTDWMIMPQSIEPMGLIQPDINKILDKYEKQAKGKRQVGYHSVMAYPFRVR